MSASAIEDRGHALADVRFGPLRLEAPLVFGAAMTKLVSQYKPEINEAVMAQYDKYSAAASDKAAQREKDEVFQAWVKQYNQKKRDEAAAEVAAVEAMQANSAEAEAQVKMQEAAFGKWLDKKKYEIEAAEVAKYERPRLPGAKLSDARNASEACCADDTLFSLMDSLVCECEGKRKGKNRVDPAQISAEFTRATVQERITEAQHMLRELEANDPRSKDEKTEARTKSKVATKILGIVSSQCASFGVVIQTIRDFMRACDKSGSGRIEKEEMKHVCEKLQLGFATPDFQELWACFSEPDANNEIDPFEFEEMVVNAEAQRQLFDPLPPLTRKEILAESVIAAIGEREARTLVNKVFDMLRDQEEEQPMQIGLWVLRTVLRSVKYPGLNTSKRTNLTRAFELLFKNLDVNREQAVLVADIQFFIRKLLLKLKRVAADNTHGKKISESDAKAALMFRIGKVMLDNVKGTMRDGHDSIVPTTVLAFKTMEGATLGIMNRLQFQHALQSLKFGLSAPQELFIIDAIDLDGNGQIDTAEFVKFIQTTESKVQALYQAKLDDLDPRNHGLLIRSILNEVSDSIEVVGPIVQDIRNALTQVFK
jgi:Ca2+-binding EF-hand superfamily protein